MPLKVHATLGPMYIDAETFRGQAAVYGCQAAVAQMSGENLEEFIALASRSVDAYCAGQGFSPDVVISENHPFDFATRRFRPNQPPVIDLLSLRLRTGPTTVATYDLTPVSMDAAGNKVGWGVIYYNRQENVMEISSMTTVGAVSSYMVTMGIMKPQVEITYRNGDAVPTEVQAATGYQAGHLINQAFLDSKITPGVLTMSTPDLSITREAGIRQGRTAEAMHHMAMMLLRKPTAITVG